ncbi:hypothetical protein A2875_02260 [Candidatus Gottesmanbacteria bacterium RIFCSPHIGHO2_01_FULL_46_14]|uniref:Uncharacterized protein n=2 Tax=Candidatus Gottesmaniibacteriota TaxID=1752720 RepID=A0A1F5ZJS1_9BACT|nr:MAG: hypothetical protein A2875_02260 [Candidatus Gottesmanbacteria bacterium RIFCSPHIGHO2_01_FULL_46_14]OGG29818.1 MAG: hypothetical protein A2971_03410 [Candidatus Gottesmanbacteria bacterium RIFCSPLOWO2_01_FULL_46_21]
MIWEIGVMGWSDRFRCWWGLDLGLGSLLFRFALGLCSGLRGLIFLFDRLGFWRHNLGRWSSAGWLGLRWSGKGGNILVPLMTFPGLVAALKLTE